MKSEKQPGGGVSEGFQMLVGKDFISTMMFEHWRSNAPYRYVQPRGPCTFHVVITILCVASQAYRAVYCNVLHCGPFASTRDRMFFLCVRPFRCILLLLLLTTTVFLGINSCHTSLCHVQSFLRPIVDILLRSIQYTLEVCSI